MKAGFLGLGKLGLPVATTLQYRGIDVLGYDLDVDRIAGYLRHPHSYPFEERGPDGRGDFRDYLKQHPIDLCLSPQALASRRDLIFVAVQTPHDARFGGEHPLTQERADFDYSHLKSAVASIAPYLTDQHTLVIISTCLPGTTRREILPLVPRGRVVFNPFFIAMGTVMADFLKPEFVLIGVDDNEHAWPLLRTYEMVYGGHPYGKVVQGTLSRIMSYESAELTKVAYNAMIGTKIAYANTVMEICDKLPHADCDDVMNAIKAATDRLASPKYLTPGMGDGGGCHPRDNIAMSWLANELRLSHNLFDDIMQCREDQARYLCEIVREECRATGLPAGIMGYAFKPNLKMVDGSPALLCHEILKADGVDALLFDPVIEWPAAFSEPRVWLIGCAHDVVSRIEYAPGSVIVDPHRRFDPKREDVRYRPVGSGE